MASSTMTAVIHIVNFCKWNKTATRINFWRSTLRFENTWYKGYGKALFSRHHVAKICRKIFLLLIKSIDGILWDRASSVDKASILCGSLLFVLWRNYLNIFAVGGSFMSHTAVVLVLLLDSVFFYSGSKNGLKGNIKMQFKKREKAQIGRLKRL